MPPLFPSTSLSLHLWYLAGCPSPSICTSDQGVSNHGFDKQVWLFQGAFCVMLEMGAGGWEKSTCIYVYPCVQQGILLPSYPFPGVLWVQTVCCFSSALVVCQVRLVRLRVLTLLQSVIRSDSLPNTDPLCLIKSNFFTNASVVDQWWKNPVLCDLHAAEH